MGKITSYAAQTAPADADLLVTVDVSDTSMAATGTDKQLTLADLRTWLFSQQAAPANFKPADPTATASTTLVMMGLGATCTYTPTSSGTVLVVVTGFALMNSGAVNLPIDAYYGTGTAPANGASTSGTRFGGAEFVRLHPASAAPASAAFAYNDVLSLTAGTAYWFDIAVATNSASDTASVENVSMTFVETS